jgi:hypothetical protein
MRVRQTSAPFGTKKVLGLVLLGATFVACSLGFGYDRYWPEPPGYVPFPKIEPVRIEMPQPIQFPEFERIEPIRTEFLVPKIPQTQKIEIPRMERIDIPRLQKVDLKPMQKIDFPAMQKVEVPRMQRVEIPRTQMVDMSRMQKVEILRTQLVDIPRMQKIDLPRMQRVEIPRIPRVDFPRQQMVDIQRQPSSTTLPAVPFYRPVDANNMAVRTYINDRLSSASLSLNTYNEWVGDKTVHDIKMAAQNGVDAARFAAGVIDHPAWTIGKKAVGIAAGVTQSLSQPGTQLHGAATLTKIACELPKPWKPFDVALYGLKHGVFSSNFDEKAPRIKTATISLNGSPEPGTYVRGEVKLVEAFQPDPAAFRTDVVMPGTFTRTRTGQYTVTHTQGVNVDIGSERSWRIPKVDIPSPPRLEHMGLSKQTYSVVQDWGQRSYAAQQRLADFARPTAVPVSEPPRTYTTPTYTFPTYKMPTYNYYTPPAYTYRFPTYTPPPTYSFRRW